MNIAVTLDFDRRPRVVPYMLRAMVPVRRQVNLFPQIRARWSQHRVDALELGEFLRITGLPAGPALPLLYPLTFGFRLAMTILTHPAFPVPIWGVLQTRNHIVRHRSIAVDASLDFETRVMHGRIVPKGAEFDLRTNVKVTGDLAWQSDVTFFTRGYFGEPGPAAPPTRSPSDTGHPVAQWDLCDADHWKFGRFTGDYNGIHLWDWYARRLGFRRALYHPQRVLGECMAHLPRHEDADGPLLLDAWIKGPIPHGAKVRLHAAALSTTTTFALYAGDDRPCIVGRLGVPMVAPETNT